MTRNPKAPTKYLRSKARNVERKAQRRAEAEARQRVRDGRSDAEQISELLWRPGFADKELARLLPWSSETAATS